MKVLPYGERGPVELLAPVTGAADIHAQLSADLVPTLPEGTEVHHVGSTAVADCPGKGIVDVLITHAPGKSGAILVQLDQMGFQDGEFGLHFPGRRGAVDVGGRRFRLHVHVIETDSPDAINMLRLREVLRRDPQARAAYAQVKSDLVTAGVTDNVKYRRAKSKIIRELLLGTGD